MKDPVMGDEMRRDKHLTNLEVVTKILESGTPEEMEELSEFHNLSKEKMDLMRYYARLRRKTLDEMHKAQDKRKRENPVASEEELSLGGYVENIEPQVRDALLRLRKKGYKTVTCGFDDFGSQSIRLESNQLENFVFPQEVASKLSQMQVEIEIKPNAIIFNHKSKIGIDDVKEVWDEIEKVIPDLDKPAEPAQVGTAVDFRKRQAKLKQ